MEINRQEPARASAGKKIRRRTASLARWLHVYLSMLSFFLVFFFAITGFTLNHADWFDGNQAEKKYTGNIPAAWVNSGDTLKIRKLEIVELLRREYHVKGYLSDFLVTDDQCSFSFKGPAYSADAFINRADGRFTLTEVQQGLVAVLNDLHKGRDSGQVWSWLIDISALFLILVSLTGLIMLFFLKKRWVNGLLLMLAGMVLSCIVYKLGVS